MRLIIPVLLNCILVLGIYLIDKYTPAKKLPHITKQVIIGTQDGMLVRFQEKDIRSKGRTAGGVRA